MTDLATELGMCVITYNLYFENNKIILTIQKMKF